MLGDDILDRDVSSGRRSGEHICSRLDLIRNDRIVRSVQAADAFNTDHVRSCALDPGTHAVEEVCKINDVGFLGRIFDRSASLRHDRCHDDVDGRAYGNYVHVDVGSDKSVRPGVNSARCQSYCRSESPEALDVLINRAKPDIAAARQRNARLLVLAQKGADQIIGTSDLSDVLIVNRSVLADP